MGNMSSLEIHPTKTFHNRLLNRHEVQLVVKHPKTSFTKKSIQPYIKKNYNSEFYVISQSKSTFGMPQTTTQVRIYNNQEDFERIEDFHVLHKAGLAKKTKDARR